MEVNMYQILPSNIRFSLCRTDMLKKTPAIINLSVETLKREVYDVSPVQHSVAAH